MAQQAMSADKIYTSFFSNKAVGGYDTVAYFEKGRPVEGKSRFSYEWNGAKWLFSSKENLETFKKAPEVYAPQYGGHCAWAVAAKKDLVKGDPKYWRIVDGRLYLNYDQSVQQQWEKDIPGFIEKGNKNWVKLNK
ncbi:YHS domain-containing (seleno)protein [Parendozoicomonas sp. Alg238-R29]|uniref:YHS domain-containing (seleno)protein n=1 Tax=Parendozoicomonas sp. Alg238-R29 TaxID=2993446 RepID=UPI00248DFC40|nr:YHS domain-containing (seleno)protein [Parendozoicomonas sp. Alg238-R29]